MTHATTDSDSTDSEPSMLEQAQAIAGASTDPEPTTATAPEAEADVDADTEADTEPDAATAEDESVEAAEVEPEPVEDHDPADEPNEADESKVNEDGEDEATVEDEAAVKDEAAVEDGPDSDVESDGDSDGSADAAADADPDAETESEVVDVTAKAKIYQDFFNQLGNLVSETKLFIDEGGWEICAVDPANVAMGKIPLSDAAFESFSVSEGVLGINLDNNDIREKIAMFDNDELVRLHLDPETRKLHITGEDGGLEFTHALINPETIRQEPEMPEMEWHNTITLSPKDLNRAIKAVDMVTDHVAFTTAAAENTFRVHGEGDTDDVDLELGPEDLFEMDISDSESLYALEYLKDLRKAMPSGSDDEITLQFSDQFPLRFTYAWNDAVDESELLLAPRIQKD